MGNNILALIDGLLAIYHVLALFTRTSRTSNFAMNWNVIVATAFAASSAALAWGHA